METTETTETIYGELIRRPNLTSTDYARLNMLTNYFVDHHAHEFIYSRLG